LPGGGQQPSRVAEVAVPHAAALAVLIAAIVFFWLISLTPGMSFRFDDFGLIISRRGWTWDALFLPNNEHWSTLTVLVFKLLFPIAGFRNYTPYVIAVILTHVLASILLFVFVRRHAGPVLALAACLTFAVLGQGADVMFWATEVSFAGSTAAGLLALILLEREARWSTAAASAALLASLMDSGLGLVYLVYVGTAGLINARPQRATLALVLPVLAYLTWFLSFGAYARNYRVSVLGNPAALPQLPGFVALGLISAVTGVFELPLLAAIPLYWAAGVAIRSGALWRHPNRVVLLGASASLVSFYTLTGVERAYANAIEQRYVYAVAPFILMVAAIALGRMRWRLARWPLLVGLVVLTGANFLVVNAMADSIRHEADARRSVLQFVDLFRRAPGADLQAQFSQKLFPEFIPADYVGATEALGAPFPVVTRKELQARHSPWVELAAQAMFHPTLVPDQDPAAPESPAICQTIPARSRDIGFDLGPGGTLMVSETLSGVTYRPVLRGHPDVSPGRPWPASAARSFRLTPGANLGWTLQVSTSRSPVTLCAPVAPTG